MMGSSPSSGSESPSLSGADAAAAVPPYPSSSSGSSAARRLACHETRCLGIIRVHLGRVRVLLRYVQGDFRYYQRGVGGWGGSEGGSWRGVGVDRGREGGGVVSDRTWDTIDIDM